MLLIVTYLCAFFAAVIPYVPLMHALRIV